MNWKLVTTLSWFAWVACCARAAFSAIMILLPALSAYPAPVAVIVALCVVTTFYAGCAFILAGEA